MHGLYSVFIDTPTLQLKKPKNAEIPGNTAMHDAEKSRLSAMKYLFLGFCRMHNPKRSFWRGYFEVSLQFLWPQIYTREFTFRYMHIVY